MIDATGISLVSLAGPRDVASHRGRTECYKKVSTMETRDTTIGKRSTWMGITMMLAVLLVASAGPSYAAWGRGGVGGFHGGFHRGFHGGFHGGFHRGFHHG